MRRQTLCAILLALCSCVGSAQSQRGARHEPGKDEAGVLAADRAWADAIARGDVAALDRVFADEYVIVSANGDVKNKRQEINNLAPAPDVTTYYFRTEDVEARVYKDAAVVRGRAVWKVKWQGRDIDNDRRYTSTYVKRGGRWLLVAQQISGNLPPVGAQTQARPAGESLEQELMRLQREQDGAEAKKDRAALERIFADDFVFTSPSGAVSDKRQLIEDILQDQTPDDQSLGYEGVRVHAYGDTAVVNYLLTVRGRDKEGKDYANRYRNTVTWVRQQGNWRIAAFHISRVRA